MRKRRTVIGVAIVFFLVGTVVGFVLGGSIPTQFPFGQPTPTPTKVSLDFRFVPTIPLTPDN